VHRQYILREQPKRCNVSHFIYLSGTLYMFQTDFPSIVRSSKLYIQRQAFVRPIPDAVCAFLSSWRKTPLKHVERLTEINKLLNCEVREKTNKMQQLDVYYQHFLNMFRTSLCPSSGEQDVCYCTAHLNVVSCWFSLSLHNLLTMHGHRNLKIVKRRIFFWLYSANLFRFSGIMPQEHLKFGHDLFLRNSFSNHTVLWRAIILDTNMLLNKALINSIHN